MANTNNANNVTAAIRAIKTFAEAMLGFVGVSGIAIGDIDWAMALGVSAAATVASVLMSVVGLPEVSVDEDGDLVIDGDDEDEKASDDNADEATSEETAEATDEETDEE